jgi:clan AA aspartic protease (TIGR02281 family)
MGKSWRIAVMVVVGSLALAAVGRADSGTAPSSDDVFKARGLTHMGFWLIVPEEADVDQGAQVLKADKQRVTIATMARRNLADEIKKATTQGDNMVDELNTLNDQWKDLDDQRKAIGQDQVVRYNQVVVQANAVYDEIKQLERAIDAQKTTIENLLQQQQDHDGDLGKAQMAYINLAMDLGSKAETVAAAYDVLAKDTDLAAAVALANQTGHVRLGPSGMFTANLQFVLQCAKEVAGAAVPVMRKPDSDEPYVQAVLNGKVTETMIWDSGATIVVLSSDTADALGIKLTDKDQTDEATVADGHTVKETIVTLDSIRVGGFTVDNVPCAILPPGEKAEDLLGDTFQGHFVVRLDQQNNLLQLSPADSSVIVGPVAETPPAPPPPSPGDSAAPPAAPAPGMPAPDGTDRGNLFATMQGDTSRHDADGSIMLQGDERITSQQQFTPPVRFTVVAQTDSTNIRLAYACDRMIFNWELQEDEFRINGGPANRQHKKLAGKLPVNQWVRLEITVLPDSMNILVDGKPYYSAKADFSKVNQALSIFPANGSKIKVKYIEEMTPQ